MTKYFKWSGGLKHLVSGFTTLGMVLFIALFIVSCSTSRDDGGAGVAPTIIPISGTIGYADQTLTTGYDGTPDVALTNSANFTAGNGTVTFTATATPVIPGLTAANNGTVTIPNGLTAGSYTVNVSVSSSAGGTVSDTSFTITIPTPISGTIGYADQTLAEGYTGTPEVALTNSADFNAGNGTVTFTATATPAISGLTAANNGTVTIPNGLTTGNYTVNVSVSSSAGGTVPNTSFMITIQGGVSGSFSYTAPAASSIVVGTASTINMDASGTLAGATNFSIAATTAGTDIGEVSINSSGVIMVNAEKVGSTEYTVTAIGETSATRTTTITLKSSLQLDLAAMINGTFGPGNTATLQRPSGTSPNTVPSWNLGAAADALLDNSRNLNYNFSADRDVLSYFYRTGNAEPFPSVASATGILTIGNSNAADSNFGLAVNPNLFVANQTSDLVVRIRRSAGNIDANLGYNVSLSNGRTSTTTGVTTPRHQSNGGSTTISDTFQDVLSSFTYGGGDATLSIFFFTPNTRVLEIESITITAQ